MNPNPPSLLNSEALAIASPGARSVRALHVSSLGNSHLRTNPVEDMLVIEGALQIRLDDVPFSVTMRTPGDDALLALGLLFSEGQISGIGDVRSVHVTPARKDGSDPDTVEVMSAWPGTKTKKAADRRLVSNASCGVCGIISVEDLCETIAVAKRDGRLDTRVLPHLEAKLRRAQSLFKQTGGSHAAAVFDIEGNLLVLKEDVGRHNAVDKAVGLLLERGLMEKAAILFISGRVSYEIVSKAARAGIAFLLAVSAPSTLAVKLCDEAGITLLGFCRGEKATIYTHPENVIIEASDAE